MCVTCPEDKKAGDALTVTAHGRRFALTVPPGVVGGQMFRVQLSIPPPEPHVQQPFWPKGPQQPKPQPKPQPQINLQPAEKLSVDLVAPHSLREAGMLTLDKRCFSLRCQARDATGAATMAPLSAAPAAARDAVCAALPWGGGTDFGTATSATQLAKAAAPLLEKPCACTTAVQVA